MTFCISFVQSPVDGYLGCFQFRVIINEAIINILGANLFGGPCAFVFLGYICSSKTVGSPIKSSCQNMFNLHLIRPVGTTASLQEIWEIEEKVRPPPENNTTSSRTSGL